MKDQWLQRSSDSAVWHGGADGRWNMHLCVCVCVYWSVWYEWMDFFKQGMICRWATVLCSRSYSFFFFLNLCLWIVITQHADADYNTKTKEELR